MPVTIGRYEYSLDDKNRLVVPLKYREALTRESGQRFILAMGFDGCLWLFLPSQWESVLEDAKAMKREAKDKVQLRAFQRQLFSSAEEVGLDEQGRILVPPPHKDYAGLKKDVVILGAGNKAEVWDRARWQSYSKKQAEPAFAAVAKDLDL